MLPDPVGPEVLFLRRDASWEELAKLTQQDNLEEMELSEDENENEMNLEPSEVQLEQQSVLVTMFQSLKKT